MIPRYTHVGERSSRVLDVAREAFLKLVFFLVTHRGCFLAQPPSEAKVIPSANCYWDPWHERDRGYIPEQDKPSPVSVVLTLGSGDEHTCKRINAKSSDKCRKEQKTAKV